MGRYKRIELLTPERAKALLEARDPRQRSLLENHAQALARAISLGEWNEDFNQSIAISDEGLMMDGQHRCRAVVIAGKPIWIQIEYNVPRDQFKYYDRNKPRTARDFYFGSNKTVAVAIATRMCCIEMGAGLTSSLNNIIRQAGNGKSSVKVKIGPTMDEILEYLADNEQEVQELAALSHKIYKRIGGGSKALIGFALWVPIYVGYDANAIRRFVEDFCEDIPTSPSIIKGKDFACRLMLKAKSQKANLSKKQIAGLTLTLFDSWKSGKPIYRANEIDKVYTKYAEMIDAIRRTSTEGK